jgi:NHLM bacteriocin system ABC transporter ATP-binding protein
MNNFSVLNLLTPLAEEIVIEANTRYIVENQDSIWLVKEHEGDLFAWERDNQHFIPLFIKSVKKGEVIFSAQPIAASPHLFFFVSSKKTTLLRLSSIALRRLMHTNSEVKAWMAVQIEQWIEAIFQLFNAETPKEDIPEIKVATKIELAPQAKIYIKAADKKHKLLWLQCTKGSIEINREPLWNFHKGQPFFFPFSVTFWMEAKETSELAIGSTDEWVDADALYLGLFYLHHTLFARFEISKQEELERFFQLNTQREEVSKKKFQDSLQQLRSVLGEETSFIPPPNADYLSIALHRIGHALNIQIMEPPLSSGQLEARIEEICMRSSLLYRSVILKEKWWKSISQPLLAFFADQLIPIAIIPAQDGSCEYLDPYTLQLTKVQNTNAQLFMSQSFAFFTPLIENKVSFSTFLKFVYRGCKRESALLIALGCGLAILNLFLPFAMKELFDLLTVSANVAILKQLTMGLILVALSVWIFSVVKNYVQQRFSSLSLIQLQMGLWGRLLHLPISLFKSLSSGEIMNSYSSTLKIHAIISSSVVMGFFSFFYLFFYFVQMMLFNVYLSCIMLLVFIAITLVYIFCMSKQLKLLGIITEATGKIGSFILQAISGLSKIRVAGAETRFFNLWSEKFANKKKLELKLQRYQACILWIGIFFPFLAMLCMYKIGLSTFETEASSNNQNLTMGSFVGFSAAFALFTTNALTLLQMLFLMIKIKPLWKNAQPLFITSPESTQNKEHIVQLNGKVALDNLSFRYEEEGEWILDDVSITAYPGEMIGIVGPSGSGKSTLVRLLLGFETSAQGTIYYDDKDFAGLDPQSVRSKIGTVLQNGALIAGSIYENIVGGGHFSTEALNQAIYHSGFEKDLQLLPMGIHTIVPMGGEGFSGGQRQQLLLARALVASPKILILDEATSALDIATQNFVNLNLEKLKMTRIVIAHRLSTMRNADRIYVLVDGKIAQVGTFSELAAQSGCFASLLQKQRNCL